MAGPLTSWKEIATHFKKSVRTVQRWEREFRLPVRRPDSHGQGIIFAFPQDLDAWMSRHLVLRSEVLRSENGNGHGAAVTVLATANFAPFSAIRHTTRRATTLSRRANNLAGEMHQQFEQLRMSFRRSEKLFQHFETQSRRAAARCLACKHIPRNESPSRAGKAGAPKSAG